MTDLTGLQKAIAAFNEDADLLLQRRVKLLADLEFTGFSKRGANKLLAVVKVTMPDNATDQ
jgi:hypothetical protein